MSKKNKINKNAGNVEKGIEFFNNSNNMCEKVESSVYSVENAKRLGIPLDGIEREIFTEYGKALEELAK